MATTPETPPDTDESGAGKEEEQPPPSVSSGPVVIGESGGPTGGAGGHRHRLDRTRTEVVGETRWLRLETVFYRCPTPPPHRSGGDDDDDDDEDGDEHATDNDAATAATAPDARLRPWDRVVRTTRAAEEGESSIDAVAILAILRDSVQSDRIVLVRQYRPAIDAFTLEMPAGLIDAGESPAEAAIREFREETGYVGEAVVGGNDGGDDGSTPPPPVPPIIPTYLSPGLTNECVAVVRLNVDMDRAENRDPRPAADGCEDARGLETVLLPLDGLAGELRRMHNAEGGVRIFGMLYTFALALELQQQTSSWK